MVVMGGGEGVSRGLDEVFPTLNVVSYLDGNGKVLGFFSERRSNDELG